MDPPVGRTPVGCLSVVGGVANWPVLLTVVHCEHRRERPPSQPFGFDLVDDDRRFKKGHPLALVANPAEQGAIAEIRALAAKGTPSVAVARELNRRAVPRKTGGV